MSKANDVIENTHVTTPIIDQIKDIDSKNKKNIQTVREKNEVPSCSSLNTVNRVFTSPCPKSISRFPAKTPVWTEPACWNFLVSITSARAQYSENPAIIVKKILGIMAFRICPVGIRRKFFKILQSLDFFVVKNSKTIQKGYREKSLN